MAARLQSLANAHIRLLPQMILHTQKLVQKGFDTQQGEVKLVKAAVTLNGGYRGERIFETNGKVFFPRSLGLQIFETIFKRFHTT